MTAQDRKISLWVNIKEAFSFVFKNFGIIIKVLTIPILLQCLGIALSLAPAIVVSADAKAGTASAVMLIPVLICSVAGLVMFCIGFWKFLLINYSLTLASGDFFDNGEIKDFTYYNGIVESRKNDYIKMLLWVALYSFGIVAILILIMLAGFSFFSSLGHIGLIVATLIAMVCTIAATLILMRFFISMPIFAFEPQVEPKNVVKRCFALSRNHILIMFVSYIALGIITYVPLNIIYQLLPIAGVLISFYLITPLTTAFWVIFYKKITQN